MIYPCVHECQVMGATCIGVKGHVSFISTIETSWVQHVFLSIKQSKTLSLPSTTMSTKKNNKWKRREGPMIDEEAESATVVTRKTIYETKKDGT